MGLSRSQVEGRPPSVFRALACQGPFVDFGNRIPDWREPGAYQDLQVADARALAWEWLRRSDEYRAAALAGFRPASNPLAAREQPRALAYGLHRFEDPRLAVPDARPIWTATSMPSVIRAQATRCSSNDAGLSLGSLAQFASVARSRGREHILLTDGLSMFRIDVSGASPCSGPVALRLELEDLTSAQAAIRALDAILHLAQRKGFRRRAAASSMHRQILLLRAWDALAEGASQRQIAAKLLSSEADENCWRTKHSSLRSRAQRLCKGAARMAGGGFWLLLD